MKGYFIILTYKKNGNSVRSHVFVKGEKRQPDYAELFFSCLVKIYLLLYILYFSVPCKTRMDANSLWKHCGRNT